MQGCCVFYRGKFCLGKLSGYPSRYRDDEEQLIGRSS